MHRRPQTIEQIDADETKLIEVHKHPLGIIIVYIQTSIAMILAVGLSFVILPSIIDNSDDAFLIATVFTAVAVMLATAVLMISTYIYKQNRIIVTDRNITQILQFGLFSRKVSQLNIVNVEDVTSVQQGFISTMFNYGVLRIETAGEQSNFHYNYCPNSGHVAKVILDTREKMLGQMHDGSEKSGRENRPKKVQTNKARRTLPPKKNKKVQAINIRGIGAEVIEHSKDNSKNQ